MSRGQSPQLPLSASLGTAAPSPGTGGSELAGSAGVNRGRSGGGSETSKIRNTPSPRAPMPGRVSLPRSLSAAVGEEGAAPSPAAAATSFVVAFVSRGAHGPGSSTLKVTALLLRRRSPASRPLVLPIAAQRSEMGARESPLRAAGRTLTSRPWEG